MNANNDQNAPRQELVDYLDAHDTRCPSCGYNLRQLRDAVCPECGLNLSAVPIAHLPTIFSDARFEKRTVRLAILCMLVVGSPILLAIVQSPLDTGTLLLLVLCIMILLVHLWIERTAHTRHIKASQSGFYDGTTNFGIYSLLLISILALPFILALIHMSSALIGML